MLGKQYGALEWAVNEMENRYQMFAEKNVSDIAEYNLLLEREGTEEILPKIVVIVDELANLMIIAKKDVEVAICRLAEKGITVGMYLIITTQRASADVITGVVKANMTSRISFAVTSQEESRMILNQSGAEKLLGKGDMLYNSVGAMKPIRVQGAYISNKEIENIVKFLKEDGGAVYNKM